MMPMRHIFITNPAAGKKDQTLSAAGHIGRLCKEMGLEYEIFVTEYPRHACEIVDRERAEHPDKVLRFYACGGDGTLNEVAGAAVQHDNTQVTHYPMGSGNDFIRMFHDLNRFHDLKELICGDVLELDYLQTDSGVSVNIFSVGADARISAGMQKYKRLPLLSGSAAYIASIGEHFIRGLCRPCHIEVDGQVFDGKQIFDSTLLEQCIKAQCEAYVLDKAEELGLVVEVDIRLDPSEMHPYPISSTIRAARA